MSYTSDSIIGSPDPEDSTGVPVIADRGLDEDQTAVQSGYAAATAALAEQATADRAALQLGVDEALEETGVVP